MVEEKTSLMIKWRSMGDSQKAVIILGVIITLIIIPSLVLIDGEHTNEKTKQKFTPAQYSGPIDGFLGVNWNDSMELAKQKLLSKGYSIRDIDYVPNTIRLEPIELGGYRARHGILNFYSRGFYSGALFFYSASEIDCEKIIKRLATIVSQKYGPPTSTFPSYDEIIYAPQSSIICYNWESKDMCQINLLNSSGSVSLMYENKKVTEKEKEIIAAERKAKEVLMEEKKREKELNIIKDLSKQF